MNEPVHMIDPAWLTLIVGIIGSVIGSVVTGAIAFAALKAWMARREEREANQGVVMARLQLVQDEHGRTIGNHSERIRVLENEMDLRPPPMDFAR
jgi:membrane protein YqaA with SNARE-associated domain